MYFLSNLGVRAVKTLVSTVSLIRKQEFQGDFSTAAAMSFLIVRNEVIS